jgi:hypothetical protein
LISLQHVSWPKRNVTLTPAVAQRILEVHKELLKLIEIRDPSGARRLMDDHVKMIRARRVSEHAGRVGESLKEAPPSFRGAPEARTRNPNANTELGSGFRVRRGACHRAALRADPLAPSRNDNGDGCC